MPVRAAAVAFVSLLALGCGESSGTDAGPVDAGPGTDAGPADAGPGIDAGPDAGGDPCEVASLPALTTESLGTGFDTALFVTQPAGDDALYIVEQPGSIRTFEAGANEVFLNIRSQVDFGGERGLLGLAFHPEFATNGRYFLYYTPTGGMRNRVSEWNGSTEVRILLDAADPESNHNGGALAFGPDGYLYVGMGDGGGGGDNHGPIGNGLSLDTVFGKIHRLDVDSARGDFAAPGNPFLAGGGLATIWAYGLRNPWRFSFDRLTGDLYIGDVGQGAWEEIDFQPRSSTGGENYGWRAYEGLMVFNADDVDLVPDHAEPVHVYDHASGGCSVSGGYVYRGSAIPQLVGWYLFADYCTGEVSAFRMCDGEAVGVRSLFDFGSNVTSFGQDEAGEIYVVGGARVERVVLAP